MNGSWLQNYKIWSIDHNMHFGYYSRGTNPFRLEAMLLRMNQKVAARLTNQGQPPNRVLDLGCGTGATIRHLLECFPKAHFTGINQDEMELRAAKASCASIVEKERVDFIAADFQALPFSEASFDAAFALESACFAEGENKTQLLAEAARVLAPGGRLVVVDGFRKHSKPLSGLVGWLYIRCCEAWKMPVLAPIDGFSETMKKVGFKGIEVDDISWKVLPSLLHIPIVAIRLFFGNIRRNDRADWRYLKALLLTFSLVPFKRHFGYYIVTCTKSSVKST